METLEENDIGLLNAWENGQDIGLTPDVLHRVMHIQSVRALLRETVAESREPASLVMAHEVELIAV